MSQDPQKPTVDAEAARVRAEVAATDERRVEEELALQREEIEKATKREHELVEKEREAEQRAARAAEEAERLRGQAGPPPPPSPRPTDPAVAVAGLPFADKLPAAARRPEVLVGAAFGGAFVIARVLKSIFD